MPSSETQTPLLKRLGELPQDQQDTLIERVFIRMNSIYGSLWASRYPSEALLAAAKAEWRLALGLKTLAQIKRAMEECHEAHRHFPPTLGEFAELCLTRHGPWLGATLPDGYQRPALPGPQSMSRAEAMQRIRDVLGLASTDQPDPPG